MNEESEGVSLNHPVTASTRDKLKRIATVTAQKTGIDYLAGGNFYIETFLDQLNQHSDFRNQVLQNLKRDPDASDLSSPEGKFVAHLKESISKGKREGILPLIINVRLVKDKPVETQNLYYQRVAETFGQDPEIVAAYFHLLDLATKHISIERPKKSLRGTSFRQDIGLGDVER